MRTQIAYEESRKKGRRGKAPRTNVQAPEKLKVQIPIALRIACLVLRISLELGAWDLELYASPPSAFLPRTVARV
jgi:hypothetical protein